MRTRPRQTTSQSGSRLPSVSAASVAVNPMRDRRSEFDKAVEREIAERFDVAAHLTDALAERAAPNTLWIVQTNMGSASDIEMLGVALDAEGFSWRGVDVKAFDSALPDISHDGPVVCYGSTGFVTNCRDSGRWFPGVWHNDDAFTWRAWAENLGALLLNSPDACELTTIAEAAVSPRPDDEMVFLRPDRDLKEFAGRVEPMGKVRAWCAEVASGCYDQVRPDTPVVIGTPYGISAEWRLFMVDGRVVGSSQYHKDGRLFKQEGTPTHVRLFAEDVAKRWSPAPVFTLDICQSGEGLYVMEAQGFNAAGHYAADLRTVVRAVSLRAAKDWVEKRNCG